MIGSRRKPQSQISSRKCAPLPFSSHVYYFIPSKKKKRKKKERSQIFVLQEEPCVGGSEGKQAGGFPKKGEILLLAYQQKAMAVLNGAGLTV